MSTNPIRIIIFAKAPLVGFAKTRLIPALGEAGAATLAKKMLETTLQNAVEVNLGKVELCVTPGATDPIWSSLSIPKSVILSDQGDGDLGDRLGHASQRAISGGESVILIGTDCPELTSAMLQSAVSFLQTDDAVIIPATDGGYVLLGLNLFHSSLFNNIAWSTNAVFKQTYNRLMNLGWRAEVMPPLHDIDEPNDLQWLPKNWLV